MRMIRDHVIRHAFVVNDKLDIWNNLWHVVLGNYDRPLVNYVNDRTVSDVIMDRLVLADAIYETIKRTEHD